MINLKALTRNQVCKQSFANEQGTTLVELAVSCTVLLSILFGLMEMSLGLYAYNAVSNAARQGSRYAIVRGADWATSTGSAVPCDGTGSAGSGYASADCTASTKDIQNFVSNLGYLNIGSNATTVSWLTAKTSGSPATTTWSACSTGTCNVAGNEVQVTVTYPFPLKVPFIPSSTLNLTSTSTLVISQ